MATMTRQRPAQLTGTWEESFPKQQATETHSSVFVKKLLAVAISNISYLRVIFPDRAFGDRNLEGMKLKILRNDKSFPGAVQMINWLKGVFDALDKKYLKVLVLGVYKNPADPDTFVEAYTFKFSYASGTQMEILANNKKLGSPINSNQTRKATFSLLHALVVLTEPLKPLPDNFQVTMKLYYYDDVTPEDYEPPGFKAATSDSIQFDDVTAKIRIGSVSTLFHTLKMRLTTDITQFQVNDEVMETGDQQEVAITAMQGLDVESEEQHSQLSTASKVHDKMVNSQSLNEATNEKPTKEAVKTSNEVAPEPNTTCLRPRSPGPEPPQHCQDSSVQCPCGSNEDDGLMIQCAKCKNWQHAVCFRILDESEAPIIHVCNRCHEPLGSNQQTTDSSLCGITDEADLKRICLWRRTLMACLELNELSAAQLSNRLAISNADASALFDRLQHEGYFKGSTSSKGRKSGLVKTLNKSKLTVDAMKNYFIIDPVSEVQKMVSQTSSADFQERRRTKCSAVVESRTSAQVHQQPAARSVSSVANQNYRFEESNTQEEFEDHQPRRKKFKSSVAAKYNEQ